MFGRRSFKPQLQSETAECGLACLAMILDFHGFSTDVHSLRKHFPISLAGQTVRSLITIADRLHLSGRAVRVGLGRLPDLKLPAILHWDFNHFVVLKKLSPRGATIVDPGVGVVRMGFEDFSRHFTGVAVEFVPTPEFQSGKERVDLTLVGLLKEINWVRGVPVILTLSFVVQMIVVTMPFLTRGIVDKGIGWASLPILLNIALILFVTYLLSSLMRFSRDIFVFHVGRMFQYKMGRNVFRHLLSLPLAFFEKRSSADISSKFGSIRELRALVSVGFINVLLDGFFFCVTLFLAARISLTLSALFVATFSVVGLIRASAVRTQLQKQEELIASENKLNNHLLETVRGMSTIKLSGIEPARQAGWLNLFEANAEGQRRLFMLDSYLSLTVEGVRGFEHAIVLLTGGYMVMEGRLTLGSLFAILAYRQQFYDRAYPILDSLRTFGFAKLQLTRLTDIVASEPEPRRGDLELTRTLLTNEIRLSSVSFRYDNDAPWILRHCSTGFRLDEFTAVIGPSGSGKTTFVKLLIGLLEPSEGEVLADDIAIGDYGLSDLRGQLGAVMQGDILLAGSMAANIASFDDDMSLERVKECARLANVDGDIERFPMGFESMVGDMGSVLSAGQRQRVMLARALYKRPRFLILDEGTANLDPAAEQTVLENLKALGIGVLAVTHRAPVLRYADRILQLSDHQLKDVTAAQAALSMSPDADAPAMQPTPSLDF